ncbi:MAG: pyridoxine 5'-phosphate synthase [Candidatus Omnitrophica bacterium]|nr:pyridoxine 5'-phosphate synthase [Candidatus Omnitrophota bacterium]
MPKLGVNIDHVATLRQARGGKVPSPKLAASEAQKGGADGITLHLREDRRHIQDFDLGEVRKSCSLPLNLEMALHPEIIRIALNFRPEKICIVPERRQEVTTEGGLDAVKNEKILQRVIPQFKKKKIEVSLFIGPSLKQIEMARKTGADAIEIHTGHYANVHKGKHPAELLKIGKAAAFARSLGLLVNAGHGLDYENVSAICCIPGIHELNIGHSIVSRAVFVGMREAVREMKNLIRTSR